MPHILSTVKSSEGLIQTKTGSINEEDRQKAADDLADHLDFTSWAGRDFIGFGSIKPSLIDKHNQHNLELTSTPSGAEIFLDDVYIGKTPMTFLVDESKHILTFLGGLGGTLIQLKIDDPLSSEDRMVSLGSTPPFSLYFDYEYSIAKYFSLGFAIDFASPYIRSESEDYQSYTPTLYSIIPSSKIIVRGLKSDLVLGLGPVFHYMTKEEVYQKYTVGPILIVGAQWNAGFRIYLNERSSERPTFIYSGFSMGAPQYHFELNGTNRGFDSMSFGLFIGGGLVF